jgi:hypothetical protein
MLNVRSKNVISKTSLTNMSNSGKSAHFRHVFANNFFEHIFLKHFFNGFEIGMKILILYFVFFDTFFDFKHFFYVILAFFPNL